jgi:hypothetical protein
MIINKFNFNLVLININNLKPYRFIEDQTLQPILAKPNDFLSEELVEITYSDNLSNEEPVETIHSSNVHQITSLI